MDVKIRLMLPEDVDNALRIWEPLDGIALSGADEPKRLREFLSKNPLTCFLAAVDGEVIGTVLGGSDGRRGYLYHLAVDPRFRGRGIGKSLVEHCLGAFRQAGLQKSHLFVVRGNDQGLEFWQAAGWKLREDILIMSMDL
jgi:ribosomal protein S18 acetylase RimI-like enzyme